jgi:hypothetical protein
VTDTITLTVADVATAISHIWTDQFNHPEWTVPAGVAEAMTAAAAALAPLEGQPPGTPVTIPVDVWQAITTYGVS